MAQCLVAAQKTAPAATFLPTSLQCIFVRGAASSLPVFYRVTKIYDGNGSLSRHVRAEQESQCVVEAFVSFSRQKSRAGHVEINHQPSMPAINTAYDLQELLSQQQAQNGLDQPFEVLDCPSQPAYDPTERKMHRWVRAKTSLQTATSSPISHLAALLLMTDHRFIGVAGRAHRLSRFSDPEYTACTLNTTPPRSQAEVQLYIEHIGQQELMENLLRNREGSNAKVVDVSVDRAISLSHAIYFHAPEEVRAESWIFAEMESPWSGDNRGLVTQRLWSQDGTLLATCSQEGIIKLKRRANI